MPQQNVNITDHQKDFIESLIGVRYSNQSEVHRAALNLLYEKEMALIASEDQALVAHAEKGLRDFLNGDYDEITTDEQLDAVWEDMEREYQAQKNGKNS